MGFINVAERTINAKLVYYGVGMGGKTTSLQAVHGILCPRNEVQLVSINTEEDSTLLFDFLPINLGQVEGFKIRIQGFTVPGQPKYKQMRKYVLAGADAVVFVVDSERSRLEENISSLESMRENLRANTSTSEDIPIVVQYNKRDLDDILSEAELDKHFKFREDVEAFPSVATESQGVFEAFVHAAGLLVESKVALYGLGKGRVAPAVVAEGARRKLWEICDAVRRNKESVALEKQPRTRLQVEEAPSQARPGRKGKKGGKKKVKGEEDGEDYELTYELREEVGTRKKEILSDEELNVELGLDRVVEPEPDAPVVEEVDESLLDKTVQSNLELAKRYGELDEYKNLLERKNEELVEVAQNTVHDLNRPVSALKLMLCTMQKGYLGELAEPVVQAVQNGLLAVQQMERLIRDLLDSSRLDHDGVTLNFQDVDMTLLVADVVRSIRYEIDEKDVRVRLEPLPAIKADEWALTKVFMNLLGNAIQYTHPDRSPVVRIWADELDDQWRFHVADNGIGIPPKDRERLFRRFERGSNTGGISGTGLGLHIIREIAVGHGGEVFFESEEGAGTEFVICLPKAPVQAQHSKVSSAEGRAEP